ncbi:MAG: PAS domain-containing protein [Planctomycetota bacterium]
MLRWARQRIAVQLALTALAAGLIAAGVLAAAEFLLFDHAHSGGPGQGDHFGELIIAGAAEAITIGATVYLVGWWLWVRRLDRLSRCVEPQGVDAAATPSEGDEIDRLGRSINQFVSRAVENEQRLQRLVAELRKTEAHLHEAQSLARLGSWEYDPVGEITWWSRQVYRIFGHDPAGPPPPLEPHLQQYHPEDRKRIVESLDRSTKTGSPYHGRYRILPDGQTLRWVEAHAYSQIDDDGRVIRVTGTVQDITEQVEREQDLQRLTRELNHRVKNNISSIIALIRQSADHADNVDALSGRLVDRLKAMAIAHEMALTNRREASSLDLIVSAMTRVYGDADAAFDIDGPDIGISADAATPLALTLHELANNAAKHGALTQPGGRVRVQWSRRPDGAVDIAWTESLPRPIDTRIEEGDGLGLARGFIEHQLSGRLDYDLDPVGLRLRIGLPASALDRPAGDHDPTARRDANPVASPSA